MKKRYSTNEFKRRNKKWADERFEQNLKSDIKRKRKRKNEQSRKGKRSVQGALSTPRISYISRKAPPNFSFVENTEPVLRYLYDIKDLCRKGYNVKIDLRWVTNLTNDAIVLLLAFVKNPKIVNGVSIQGTYPNDERLRKIFVESGVFSNEGNSKGTKNYILTRKNKKAEGGIASDLIERATKVVFGENGRCPGVYRALMESMANTCYHAKPQQIGEETWWLTVYHDNVDNHVSFAFIDLGVGIFKSAKMSSFRNQVSSLLGLTDNKDILKEIISGRKLSSTKIPYRGKGLPTIFKGLERNYYSNLKIISNDVKADLTKGEFIKMNTEFKGTFLYWELNNTNRWTKS